MNTIISKLEQDDRILAELDNQLRSVSSRNRSSSKDPTTTTTDLLNTGESSIITTTVGNSINKSKTTTSYSAENKLKTTGSISGHHQKYSSLPSTSLLNSNTNTNHDLLLHNVVDSSTTPPPSSWKFKQDYQSVLDTTSNTNITAPAADHHHHHQLSSSSRDSPFRNLEQEKTRKASINTYSTSSISNELKRIEESLAAVRSDLTTTKPSSSNDHFDGTTTTNVSGSRIGGNARFSTTTGSNLLTQEHHHLDHEKQDRVSSVTSKPLVSTATKTTKIERYGLNASSGHKRQTSNVLSKDLDLLMEKLERDNKILAELDKKLKHVSGTTVGSDEISGQQLSSSLPSYINTAATASNLPKTSTLADQHHISKSSNLIHSANNPSTSAVLPASSTLAASRVPQDSYSAQIKELKEAEEIVDSIELPNRGRCKVFIAKYNYDPYKHSPNNDPETELTLLAGDFVLVFGNIDQDGFYYGEVLDGRRGLVPSNFIEKLTGDDLFEFQARVLYGHNKETESDTASFPPEFYDAILSEQIGHTSFQHLLAPDDFHRINDYIDLEDATEIDEDLSEPERAEQEAAKTTVPPPQRLIVERQLHKSVLIGWLHPECPRTMIDHYQIYVDGVLKATIPSGDRTKALVEGVDSSMPHRISIRAIDRNGRHSKDPGCTIVIGKNIPFAPCCVKASNISSDSVLISWIPCNSNFYHVVAVNSVEVRTVKPSTYKHLIVGLSANTLYRVSVRAKPGKLLCSDEKNPKKLEMLTTFVDFRTLPKSLPDPPVDIQVEAGPQEGTLLVTWLPITLNQFGTSNNCPVTGYAVFAGHKKLAEIDSPTGDHALLDISSLEHLHKKQITVRTKSGENLSQDSMPCQIPDDLLKLSLNNPNQPLKRTQMIMVHLSDDSESDTDLNRLMHNVARRSKEFELVSQPQQQQQHQHQHHQQPINQEQTRTKFQSIQGTAYDQRNRMIQSSRQQQQQSNRPTTSGGRIVQTNAQTNVHGVHPADMSRMTIPAIEITKETPSESVQPMESYSEEEFDHSMKQRVYGGKRSGVSPMPPQRTRTLSEFERSNLGPYSQQLSHRRPNQRDREHGVRWFVALFDYDPMTMSPNPDAAEEELPFQEGQLIKIYGDKDADGFYRGECNGRIGYVPCNMVSEVQYDVESDPRYRSNPNDPLSHLQIRKMIALYDYDPQELSPNFDTETELAFRTGDIIYVYGDMDEDGFYIGEANGMRGLVPSNFLADAGPVEPSNVRHAKLMSGMQQQQVLGQMQQQPQTRQLNQSNTMAMAQSAIQPGMMGSGMVTQAMPGQMQVPGATTQQQQYNQQTMQQQFVNQPTVQTNFQTGQTTVAPSGMFQTNTMQQQQQQQQQMLLQQQQAHPQQQQQQLQAQTQQQMFQQQPTTGQQILGTNQQQAQMFQQPQQTTGVFQQQSQITQPTQQPITHQQNPLQANQSMGRGVMRQQNPMLNVGGHQQQQAQFNPMFQGPGTNLGNKQRPNSLDLNIGTTPRFGQQMANQTGAFGGPMQTQQTGQLQMQPGQQPGQQQQSTGMLGSLFASGKKLLDEATTPLGARGPLAHPNQPHQPMMGHHQPGQAPMPNQPGQMQPQTTQMGGFGQPQQQFNPMMAGQAGQPGQPGQPSGTILNTMKNIFKL